eukprot:gene11069-12328_t
MSSSSLSVSDLITRNENYFASQSKDELIDSLMVLINHIKDLESSQLKKVTGKKRPVSEVQSAAPAPVDVSGTVDKLRAIIQKQIKSQLKWKASYKTGKAQWKYEGLVASEEVFKALMGCETKFKRKKLSLEDFYEIIGTWNISASIRYDTLSLCGDVTASWNADTKEFGFSGKYGK